MSADSHQYKFLLHQELQMLVHFVESVANVNICMKYFRNYEICSTSFAFRFVLMKNNNDKKENSN
jgi:hypothetical protein